MPEVIEHLEYYLKATAGGPQSSFLQALYPVSLEKTHRKPLRIYWGGTLKLPVGDR